MSVSRPIPFASQAGATRADFYFMYDGPANWGALTVRSAHATQVTWTNVYSTSVPAIGVWTDLAAVSHAGRCGYVNGALEVTLPGAAVGPSTGPVRMS